MRVKTGWHNEEYYVVKPLHNHCRQELIMSAYCYSGKWHICAGVFSCNTTYYSYAHSEVWRTPTSTNKNPSLKIITYALEALSEIEQAISVNKKRCIVYIDGLDERRLKVYTKVLNKYNCGYKQSSSENKNTDLPKLYKVLRG